MALESSETSNRGLLTYSREDLLQLRSSIWCKQKPAISLPPGIKLRRRGRRGGVRTRLRKRPFRPPLPSIILANVRSLRNKMDLLHANSAFNTIQRHQLIKKSHHLNIPPPLIHWIHNFISNRPQTTHTPAQGLQRVHTFSPASTMDPKQPNLPPRTSTLIHQGPPKRYRLHTEKKVLDDNGKVRKWTYGKKDTSKQNKIVLLVGETGAGKTTIINNMVNYLLDMKFEEEMWYEVTEEEARDQSDSQTSEITMYEVCPIKSPISLTIIDTPGYGDTRGLEKDLEVAANLSMLFQSSD
ncbi:unnamed protein product [Leuciscus chuanchicus]